MPVTPSPMDGPIDGRELLAEEMPHAQFVKARSIVEWRARPERLNEIATAFVHECWDGSSARRRSRRAPA